MKKSLAFLFPGIMSVILFSLFSVPSFAVPGTILYSGKLLDATGNIVNGNVDMTVTIYDALTGGTALYVDRNTAALGTQITVTDGMYSVVLGDDDAGGGTYDNLPDTLASSDTLYVQITIGSNDLSPREKLQAVPYAVNSGGAITTRATRELNNLQNVAVNSDIIAANDNSINLGSASKTWKDLFLKGNISDGTNNVPVANLATLNGSQALTNKTINPASNSVTLANGSVLIGNASNVAAAQTISGDFTVSNAGVATIQPNSVALGTDTTGNYVAAVADAGATTIANSGTESAAVTVAVNVDNSGIEINSNKLQLKDSGITSAKIANATIQNAKLANSSVTVTAGDGLKTGGTVALGGTVAVDVDPGDGIQIAADKVAVDGTVLRTSGDQSMAGVKTFTSIPVLPAVDPTSSDQAVRKSYVDDRISGLVWKDSVRVATTGNIIPSGIQTIDGVAVIPSDRVLVKDQTDQKQNGVYLVSTGAWSRTTDMDQDSEVKGSTVFVRSGTTLVATAWVCSNTGTVIIGTTNITFAQFSGAVIFNAGSGLALSGNTFSVGTTANCGITANADDIQVNVDGSTLEINANALRIKDLGVTTAKIANDAITLGTKTTGNYVASIADAGNGTITVSGSGSETAAVTLDVAAGGISANNLAVNSVTTSKIADNNVTLAKIADGGANQVLTTDASNNPQWENKSIFTSSSLTQNNIFVGNASNVATAAANLPAAALPLGGNWTLTSNLNFDGDTLVIDQANNRVGIGNNAPTAALHLKAGTASANTAPLKLTSGSSLTTPEAGAVEYDGTNLYVTPNSLTRKTVALVNDATIDPRTFSYFFDDFESSATTGIVWTATNTGTGAGETVATVTSTDNAQGVLTFSTGTNATGIACLYKSATGLILGKGEFTFEARVNVPVLSTTAQEFAFAVGLHDNTASGAVDGVYFIYDRLVSGTNWQCVTSNNSTRTTTASSVAVTAGSWVRLKAIVNPAGTSVTYYINDTSVATITTNIPTAAGRVTGPRILMVKSAGTTASIVNVDYWYHQIKFTTSR